MQHGRNRNQAGAVRGGAARTVSLWPDECMRLVGDQGTGRFVFDTERGPVALPVSYRVAGGAVWFRVSEHSSIARSLPSAPSGFEVDQIGGPEGHSWSVLLTGRARRVDDPDTVARLEAATPEGNGPPPPTVWVRFVPVERSGRLGTTEECAGGG